MGPSDNSILAAARQVPGTAEEVARWRAGLDVEAAPLEALSQIATGRELARLLDDCETYAARSRISADAERAAEIGEKLAAVANLCGHYRLVSPLMGLGIHDAAFVEAVRKALAAILAERAGVAVAGGAAA